MTKIEFTEEALVRLQKSAKGTLRYQSTKEAQLLVTTPLLLPLRLLSSVHSIQLVTVRWPFLRSCPLMSLSFSSICTFLII